MEGHESSRGHSKREGEGSADARNRRVGDDEEWESDKRKHKASKSRNQVDAEEMEDQDCGRRSSGDRNEARKKSGGLSRTDSGDEDDYDTKRELRSKIPRKSANEGLEKQSNEGYCDRDLEGNRKRDDESELDSSKKSISRPLGSENSQGKARSKVESLYDACLGKYQDRDSRPSDKQDSNKYRKDQGQYDHERNPQSGKWDKTDDGKKDEDGNYAERSDPRTGKVSNHNKHGPSRNREPDSRNESIESKSRVAVTTVERGTRSGDGDDWREDNVRSRNHGRLELRSEDDEMDQASRETRSDVKDDKQRRVRERSPISIEDMELRKSEKPKQQRDCTHDSRDEMDNLDRSMPMDVDGRPQMWDRNGRDAKYNRRSRSPERTGRNYRELDEHDHGFSDSDTERSIGSNKGKEREKDGYREGRSSKGKDYIWNEKSGEPEGSKDQWRRNQARQDSKDVDDFDHLKEWDIRRRDHGRLGNENIHSRPGYRKDVWSRPEGVRGSSFGNRNENSDSIEIRPNRNLDFGREDLVAAFPGRKSDMGSQQEFPSGANDGEWGYLNQEKGKPVYGYNDNFQEKHLDDGSPLDQTSGGNFLDSQVVKGRLQKNEMETAHTYTANSNSQSSFSNYQGAGPPNRSQQGSKGGRPVRGGRGRLTGRDSQRVGLPPPIIGPSFGLGLPPGQLQPIGPNMNHSPLPPIGPGGFIPPFSGPLAWPGARGVDMNMLGPPPNLPLIPPPGTAGPRFPPNMGPGPGHPMHFNQPGPGRVVPHGILSPGSNVVGPGREALADKVSGGWVPPRINGPPVKAPSRGEQNDYSQNFVDTGMRPQNFIRELELTSTVEDYPKLRELIQRKDEIVEKSATPPMYYKCDLREFVLTPEFFGTKFDVILVDPPWEEYVHRAPGITDHLEYWTVEEMMNLKIEAIADTPSFIFLWVGDGVGLEQGRQCLKKWGFRRCEDICWVKTNKKNAAPGLRHDSRTLFQHSKEHCLMGIKGTVRRSTDGHIIHANIDTDIIIAEEPSDAGSTKKPEDMYRIIEHFALGRRRLELFGEDHNIRSGWLTVGSGLSSSNFNSEAYIMNFCDNDGKVWQGGGGRNPPPDAPHLVLTTPEIENLRPKSPPSKNQQQQGTPLPLVTGSNNRRASGNSPQNPVVGLLSGMNIDPIGSEPATPAHWASPVVGFRGPDGGVSGPDVFEGYGYNSPFMQGMGDYTDFDSHRAANFL